MSDVPEDQRRAAERLELSEPIEATLVDVPARITEISLINCRLEHTGKVAMGSNVTLQFDWSGEKIKLKGKLTRSEMRPIGGRLTYISSMQFADSIETAPFAVRRIIAALVGDKEEAMPPPPLPVAIPMPDEVEELDPDTELPVRYVQCVLEAGKWTKSEVAEPRQPREGFTMIAPEDPAEVDQFCKTYEMADPETRQMIRLSFELAISRVNG